MARHKSLAEERPDLLNEWNEKNNELGIFPDKVSACSSKKVWWVCWKGHEWKVSIANRSNGSNCPVCSHHKVLSGYNDLKTTRPDLLKEWDYEKNNELGIFPDKVSYGSSKKVWWKCHVCACEWETSVSNRTRKNGRGCPRCNSRYGTSFPEQAVFYFLKMLWNVNIYNRYKINNQMEVDVYCPDKKIGIEYDGTYWHQNKREKDINKEKQLKKIGIKLFRIIESNENRVDGNKIYYNSRERYNYDNLSWAISRLLDMFGVGSLFVDVDAYQIEIQEQYKTNVLKNSLANVNPELAKQWHPTKNGTLTSYNFLPNSNDKVWWLCPKCGYEWKTFISHRNKSHGCPACAGQVIWKGNDFETLYPDIAKQWHPTLNGGRKPSEFRPCSGKTVFWLCPNCNHVWRTSIQQRVKFHTGCPKCYKINRKKKK